jgi:hypothetical protein
MAKVEFERTKPHVNVATTARLRQVGVSLLGAHQLQSGQIITDARDRQVIAEIVAAALDPHARHLVSGHKFTLTSLPVEPTSLPVRS